MDRLLMQWWEVHAEAVGKGNHDLIAEKLRIDERTSQRWASDPRVYGVGDPSGRNSPLVRAVPYFDAVDYARREAVREGRRPGGGMAVIVDAVRNYAAAHYDMGLKFPQMNRAEMIAYLRRQREEMTAMLLTLEREEAGAVPKITMVS
jgi:hypothetical protein